MPQGYHHLDQDQRCQLDTLKERGDSLAVIAQALGVHRSSVCREISRNTGKRGYRYKQANENAQQRRNIACQAKKKMTPSMIILIEEKLRLQWSPVQIAGWLKKNNYAQAVSHETIYQHVWLDKRKGGSLYKGASSSWKKIQQTKQRNCRPRMYSQSNRHQGETPYCRQENSTW